MADTNGAGETRLDRLEKLIERQVLANEAAHERFEAEDKRLLTSQILMNDAMTKMNYAMSTMAEAAATLDRKMLETTEKLDALIRVVDDSIRNSPRNSPPAQ